MAIFGTKKGDKKEKVAIEKRTRFARANTHANGAAHDTIRHPWFSEKALLATEKGVYTFAVPEGATKADIAGAIFELYKVKPKTVRIVNLPAKTKNMRGRRGTGTRARRHKAYVSLNAGDTITFA